MNKKRAILLAGGLMGAYGTGKAIEDVGKAVAHTRDTDATESFHQQMTKIDEEKHVRIEELKQALLEVDEAHRKAEKQQINNAELALPAEAEETFTMLETELLDYIKHTHTKEFGPPTHFDDSTDKIQTERIRMLVHTLLKNYDIWAARSSTEFRKDMIELLQRAAQVNPDFFKINEKTEKIDTDFLQSAMFAAVDNGNYIADKHSSASFADFEDIDEDFDQDDEEKKKENVARLHDIIYSYMYPVAPTSVPAPTLDKPHKHHHSKHKK